MRTQDTPGFIGGASLRRGLIALWCLVTVGCAPVTNESTESASTTAVPTLPAGIPPTADHAAAPEAPSFPPVAEVTDRTEPIDEPRVAAEPEPTPPAIPPADVAPEAPEPAIISPATAATEVFEPAPGLIAPSGGPPASAETLDLSSLVARLRKTKAINLRTKVAVKNESDELLDRARAYHTHTGETTLDDLRRSYDSLFHKLHSLLEDADPPLARDIDRSRAAIWELLADPRKFSASHLMTGA